MTQPKVEKAPRSKFPPLYWLVVVFEFFERGSYYGVMSILTVYLSDILNFAKEDVGVIKGTIQPLLYFLPIISGALADRFGYRRTLMVAFSLMGCGYFLTSQMTGYSAVFLSLVVMGVGAGAFKPVISGTIARCTDETNSTLGFGIFYWSINLGAFVFPLLLVPYLKNTVGWHWVLIAAAIGTSMLLIPTILVYREPPAPDDADDLDKPPLLQTLANAFEIIYSPVVLLRHMMGSSGAGPLILIILLAATLGYGGYDFHRDHLTTSVFKVAGPDGVPERKLFLDVATDRTLGASWTLSPAGDRRYLLTVRSGDEYMACKASVLARIRSSTSAPKLAQATLDNAVKKAASRPFLLLFVGLLLSCALVVMRVARGLRDAPASQRTTAVFATLAGFQLLLWGLHLLFGLSTFATILCGVISVTVVSLYAIDTDEVERFKDHARFLLMICIYAGFWVLYFQMTDSVCWYVADYVDASSLDTTVNGLLAAVGLPAIFKWDIEHVTVVNAGTIILLQLLVSRIVETTKAMPTMIAGIAFGTMGMGILAISTSIWVFIAGTVIFSVGEMVAHPKFISYVGQTAPKSRVAMYMGYLFLYGVIGSGVGAPLGANLYVKLVDELNRPRTLWLIFTGIGVATIVGLLLYNRFVAKPATEQTNEQGG